MPCDLHERLDWFFENFDLKKAAKGEFEPSQGMNEDYDAACEEIEVIFSELDTYKREMSEYLGQGAKQSWKYINTKEDSKDKYFIELPATIKVPNEFSVKGKRGKGHNQINKYRVPEVEVLVQRLERAIDVKKEGKSMGMKMVFARFDDMRETWKTAMMATAMLGKCSVPKAHYFVFILKVFVTSHRCHRIVGCSRRTAWILPPEHCSMSSK
jgi:DNA mismatch repair protein MSH6